MVEEHVDLLEHVDHHEDDDEAEQPERQVAGEFAQQVAVEHLHAPAMAGCLRIGHDRPSSQARSVV